MSDEIKFKIDRKQLINDDGFDLNSYLVSRIISQANKSHMRVSSIQPVKKIGIKQKILNFLKISIPQGIITLECENCHSTKTIIEDYFFYKSAYYIPDVCEKCFGIKLKYW